jgi:hypothetical protein
MRKPARLPRKLTLPAHPRFKGFEAFAAREILPHIAKKEAERAKLLGFAKKTVIAVAVLMAGLAALAILGLLDMFGLLALAIVIALAAAFAAGWPLLSFASSFNEFLVAKTCEHLGLRHTGASSSLPIAHFTAARFLPAHDSYRFEDGMECEGSDLAFNAAETILSESQSDSDGSSSDTTVWRGMLMEVRVQRRFEGRTLVLPRGGKLQFALDKRDLERIQLGLGEIEDALEIRTTHPSEARAVLGARLMRRLADIAARPGSERAALGLAGGGVLVAIESDRDRFQGGSVFQPIDLTEQLGRIAADIALLLELAETVRDALGERAPER